MVSTEKQAGKKKRDLRVSADDQRRFRQLLDPFEKVSSFFRPTAMGIEVYAPYPGRMGGNAWKAAAVYGGVSFWAMVHGIIVLPFLPMDVKMGLCGKKTASKAKVEEEAIQRIGGLAKSLDMLPKGKREHLADAAGHGYLALMEVQEMRAIAGVR